MRAPTRRFCKSSIGSIISAGGMAPTAASFGAPACISANSAKKAWAIASAIASFVDNGVGAGRRKRSARAFFIG
jgi:hypothetical protein